VMQGNEAPRSIMNALDLIYEYEDLFDAVVIIRGGGAQLDLACFDQYDLAFHVAQFPLPVITGIGHDKDDTVIDLVAHTRMKTPTAVAEFLIGGALRFSQELEELETNFIELITNQLEDHKSRLNDAADQLNLLVGQMIVTQQNRLNIARIQLANRSEAFLKNQQADLKRLVIETRNLSGKFVTLQNHLLAQSRNRLNFIFRGQILKNKNLLNQYQHLIKIQATEQIRAEKKNLISIQEKLRLVDPQNILKRGYSLTMLNGKVVKSVNQLVEGDLLETRLGDGTLESTVEKIAKKT